MSAYADGPEILTDAELYEEAQGCTELTCIYHGQINAEIRRRGLPRYKSERSGA